MMPLALAGGVSPVMFTEQTVLLAGRNGRRVAGSYALGVGATALVILSALVFFGRSIALPEQPRLSASLDVFLGCALVLIAAVLHYRRPRTKDPASSRPRGFGPVHALGFGVFSMATNFTTLAVMVPIAKEIATSQLGLIGRLVVLGIVVVLAALPAWLPIAMTQVAPAVTRRVLAVLTHLIETRSRQATVLLLAAVGLFLVGRGVVRLVGL
ncbi:GAP family protein [Nocardioides sp. zg-536]|uniref:GAP family protein n=2 Tax=Nocardioides faecalis TaxID=2803858 RepID=A0A938YA08_9ACTN|nr:GAP family protein [Nocardioides faecalis]QVI58038.1 GAP family protein [Nocardioides faecalis]